MLKIGVVTGKRSKGCVDFLFRETRAMTEDIICCKDPSQTMKRGFFRIHFIRMTYKSEGKLFRWGTTMQGLVIP